MTKSALYNARYFKKYPDRVKASTNKWRKSNPEKMTLMRMIQRCHDPNTPYYKYYGGRGIKCFFTSAQQIIDEIGYRPKGMSIDRINNEGHYEPGNIRWATRGQQLRNRRKYD